MSEANFGTTASAGHWGQKMLEGVHSASAGAQHGQIVPLIMRWPHRNAGSEPARSAPAQRLAQKLPRGKHVAQLGLAPAHGCQAPACPGALVATALSGHCSGALIRLASWHAMFNK